MSSLVSWISGELASNPNLSIVSASFGKAICAISSFPMQVPFGNHVSWSDRFVIKTDLGELLLKMQCDDESPFLRNRFSDGDNIH